MSYQLSVWEQPAHLPLPGSVDEAREQRDWLRHHGGANAKFRELGRALRARFPGQVAGDVDSWGAGPVLEFGLASGPTLDQEVLHAVAQARALGLHLSDPQAGALFLADGRTLPPDEHLDNAAALDAWHRRDFAAARAGFTALAARGNREALRHLARFYLEGLGTRRHLGLGAALLELGVPAEGDAERNAHAGRAQAARERLGPALKPECEALIERLRAAGAALATAIDAERSAIDARFETLMRHIYDVDRRRDNALELRRLAQGGHEGAAYRMSIECLAGKLFASDAEVSRSWCQRAAKWGDARARYAWGRMLALGSDGVTQDLDEAERWLRLAQAGGDPDAVAVLAEIALRRSGRQAEAMTPAERSAFETAAIARIERQRLAEAGGADAQHAFASMLHAGEGGPPDPIAAAHWFGRAAAQGQRDAMHMLGVIAADPTAGAQYDEVAARQWFASAANLGHAAGQFELARLLERGQGGAADLMRALHWYEQAAAQGHGEAIFRLGGAYDSGQGVPKDRMLAKALFLLARQLGCELRAEGVKFRSSEADKLRAMVRELSEPGRMLTLLRERRAAPGGGPAPAALQPAPAPIAPVAARGAPAAPIDAVIGANALAAAPATAAAARAPAFAPMADDFAFVDGEDADGWHLGHAALVIGIMGPLLLVGTVRVSPLAFRAWMLAICLAGAWGVWRCARDFGDGAIARGIMAAFAAVPGVGVVINASMLLRVIKHRAD